jgi:DNA-binding PadR family transcriptional regulator
LFQAREFTHLCQRRSLRACEPGHFHAKVSELSGDKEVNLGAVYVTLERLSEKGYLESWMADPTPERGGRSKRYYRLEAEGARALQKSLSTSQRIHEALGDSWRIGKWRPRRAK